QASKLALAAQVGEISLIPRNPDDEEAADTSETTVDDLLATRSDMNSRSKEQGSSKEDDHAAGNGLLNAVHAAIAPKAPFRMEIVEAQAVREVLFDSESGRPIRPAADANGPTVQPSLNAPVGPMPTPPTAPPATKPAAGDKALDDFPVEFN